MRSQSQFRGTHARRIPASRCIFVSVTATRWAFAAASIISGAASASPQAPIYSMQGIGAGDSFGKAVAAISDVNGDGHEDIAVGAPMADVGGNNRGAVTVFSGQSGALLYSVYGQFNNDQFGIQARSRYATLAARRSTVGQSSFGLVL